MKKNGMKSARWEILARDAEESGTTPGFVPQPKVRVKARGAKAKAKTSTVPGPKNGNGQGTGKSTGKGESKTGSPGQCYGSDEYGHRVVNCPKWKTFAIEQNEEAEAQEETVQVASVYWDVGCVEVKPDFTVTREHDGPQAGWTRRTKACMQQSFRNAARDSACKTSLLAVSEGHCVELPTATEVVTCTFFTRLFWWRN